VRQNPCNGLPLDEAAALSNEELQLHVQNIGGAGNYVILEASEWPPRLHGTGTEDYFNTAWCPTQIVSTPYHGIPLPGGPNWSGQISLYRLHIEDPVLFERSIRVTIEHGHANKRADDYASTAY